jgi:hypothetical protein
MKSTFSLSGFLFLFWILTFFSLDFKSFAQGEIAQAADDHNGIILNMPKANLKQTINDTILPTLCNSGDGLVHYESVSLLQSRENANPAVMGERKSMAENDAVFTESELKILKEQQNLIEDQFESDWQQYMKDANIDIELGEIIKGFYLKPPN